MRKMHREIKDMDLIRQALHETHVCHLAMLHPDGSPYVVPLNFGYVEPDAPEGLGRLYIHGAVEGTRVRCIAADGRVAFSVVAAYEIMRGEKACQFSSRFVSVCGRGRAVMVEDPDEIRAGLEAIMRDHGHPSFDFAPEALAVTGVVRVEIEELTGKRNPAPKPASEAGSAE